jgi:hypothetical protein
MGKIQDILHVFLPGVEFGNKCPKYVFLHVGVSPEILQYLKDLLHFSCKELVVGFKYLGYLMKANCYKSEDWQWLIDKFQTRINHWCNKWLSLGGHFMLIKAILERFLVYSMTLPHILVSVLHKLHKLSISFLWSGNKNKHSYHLCSWHTITKPKHYGGWCLRNSFVFYRALEKNTLWRALMKPGLWKRVIKEKYILHGSVLSWLQSAEAFSSFGSQSWKNTCNTLPMILHWMAWNPGSGHSILVGRDAILGMAQDYFLS